MEKLGSGGMGEVYLAEDTRLGRKVALKLLPAQFTQDESRLRRFVLEAKAASALNHPNIITIYEIGEAGGIHYIATEFIEGRTLRQWIASEPPEMAGTVEIGLQVASALVAAHAAGIVHRDIKPENLMSRPDGLVKVLDFGLAKLTEQTAAIDTAAPTSVKVNTDAGTVMGTVQYMSPEQTRGQELDARTDIFSLAVVLYEMFAGKPPFDGSYTSDVIAAILTKEPPRLSSCVPGVPPELDRIVIKALEKDREERYQTVRDLQNDLKRLKQRLDFEEELQRSSSASQANAVVGGNRSQAVIMTARQAVSTVDGGAAHTSSGVEYLFGEIKRYKRVALLVLGSMVITVASFAYLNGRGNAIESVAILPFVNVGGDPEIEYLSDGLTESLINNLSQLPKLRVMSRNSVFRYKGQETDAVAAGRTLGVVAVLTGRMSQRGDTLWISLELVDARDNSHLWGHQYSSKLADILAVQGEIAKQISEKLRLRLSGEQQQHLAVRSTASTEAYHAYLKGRYYWNKRTEDGLRRAIEYFQQATEIDRNYALAYAGLADSYALIPMFGSTATQGVVADAKTAAHKALELDDRLAEAHTSLGFVMEFYDWDFVGAEREFKRAIELDPNYATGHHWYSILLGNVLGRFEEAIGEAKLAQRLDPLSLIINKDAASQLVAARQYDQAIEQLKQTLEMDPDFDVARWELARAYAGNGMYEQAIAEYQRTINHAGRLPYILAALGYDYAASGKRNEAQKLRDELLERSKREYISSTDLAIVYAGLGEKDKAFEWLNKAYTERNFDLAYSLKTSRNYDTLRKDPRFTDLLNRVGLAP